MDIMQVCGAFPDRQSCIEYLEELRWDGDPQCAHCGSKNVGRTHVNGKSERFNCYEYRCKSSFSVTTGTMFHKTKIPLQKWFIAIHFIFDSKKGISSPQLARHLGLTVPSAWYLMIRIRREMEKQESDSKELLEGIVEADETYVGGKPKGRRKPDDPPYRKSEKMPFLGAVERDSGKVVVRLAKGNHHPRFESLNAQIQKFIYETVKTEKTVLMSDGLNAYTPLGEIMPHYSIKKGDGEFDQVRELTEDGDKICTNQIESFWARIKRAWYGTHHWYSETHAPLYIAEACYKFNRRDCDNPFGAFLTRCFT